MTSTQRLGYGLGTPGGFNDASELPPIESDVGEAPTIIMAFADFTQSAPITDMDAVNARGQTPLLAWEPWVANNNPTQPSYALSNIIAGDFDTYINTWASALKSWGKPVIIRWGPEMNGDWRPWSEQVNGNQPGQYVTAWQHVHDIFTAAAVGNVTWMWCPINVYGGSIPLTGLYPGSGYVDVVGIDGYNWGDTNNKVWQSPAEVFGPTLTQVRSIAPGLPIIIAETACAESGGSKPDWITALIPYLSAQADVTAFVWFDYNKETDWRINSSPASVAAFRDALASRPDRSIPVTADRFDFEGGTDGASQTTANTGATLVSTTGGTAKFATAAALNGSLGGQFVSTSGTAVLTRFLPSSTSKTMAYSFAFSIPAIPVDVGHTVMVATLRRSTGPALRFQVDNNARFSLNDADNTASLQFVTPTNGTIVAGTKYRVEALVVVGTTSSNSSVKVNVYEGNDTSTPLSAQFVSTTFNLGTTEIVASDVGCINNIASGYTVNIDDVSFNAGGTTEIGPNNTSSAPAVTPGGTQYVQAGTSVTLTATGTDSDGTVTTLTGAFTASPGTAPTLSGGASGTGTATASLTQTCTPTDPGTYVWTATATDNSSLTGTGATTMYVYPASNADTNIVSVTGSSWANTGGAASILAAVTDANDATYAKSPDGPNGELLTITCGPIGAGSLDFYLKGKTTASSPTVTRTVKVYKSDGTTLIYTATPYALTASLVETHISVDSTGLDMVPALSDRVGLVVTVSDQV